MNADQPSDGQIDPQSAVELLFAILSPGLTEQAKKLASGEYQLVHYTSAENALNILKSDRFWLRNVRCMDDYSEIQHGIRLLLRVFNENEEARIKRLIAVFDQSAPGAAKAAIDRFNGWIPSLPDNVFIGCLSLFDPNDDYGRLSMWRAYSANKAGVALVMNNHPFLAETDELKAYSLPVAYVSDVEFALGIDRCLETLEQNISVISALTVETIDNMIFWWLLCLAVALKHPAFVEEREWRVIYIPSMDRSPVIEESVEAIGGLPQVVQKIPLKDEPQNGLHKADVANLINKILIGPSEFPLVLYDAFVAALAAKEVPDATNKVAISFIPLR
jgi:hypothetical protein